MKGAAVVPPRKIRRPRINRPRIGGISQNFLFSLSIPQISPKRLNCGRFPPASFKGSFCWSPMARSSELAVVTFDVSDAFSILPISRKRFVRPFPQAQLAERPHEDACTGYDGEVKKP